MASFLSVSLILGLASAACVSSGDQTAINNLFSSGGPGAIVQLCPKTVLSVSAPIIFTAANQEISTQGYPTDNTRATIQPAAGSNVTTMIQANGISGLRVLNIQVDGLRPTLGLVPKGGANIDLGGSSNGIVISNIVSKNTRGWSCLHVIQSGSTTAPCTNVTITNNQIGPCGKEGHDSAGNSQWADGISFACENGLIENNMIEGSTDGGIVLFGAPGTTVRDNTITSSATDSGFGAINMVDFLYNGSYSNVLVTNNTITGQKLFNVGIAIGAYAWSFNDNTFLSGPATISDNKFTGNIPFGIAVNGWTNGLTVTGNDISALNNPSTSFSDANGCSAATKALWNANDRLVYYPAGLTGPPNLQSGFIASPANATNFICTTPPLPNTISYGLNGLNVGINTVLAQLHNNIFTQYQGDGNIVTYNTSTGNAVPVWASGHTSSACGTSSTACTCDFQGDGNWVTYANGQPLFTSNTAGKGHTLTFLNQAPWIEITDASGAVIWTTANAT